MAGALRGSSRRPGGAARNLPTARPAAREQLRLQQSSRTKIPNGDRFRKPLQSPLTGTKHITKHKAPAKPLFFLSEGMWIPLVTSNATVTSAAPAPISFRVCNKMLRLLRYFKFEKELKKPNELRIMTAQTTVRGDAALSGAAEARSSEIGEPQI